MAEREFTCIVCGQKGIDRSSTGIRKFCSKYCSGRYRDSLRYPRKKPEAPGCCFNEGVACFKKECSNCGWNPEVAKKRRVSFE